jgi:DNA polymerase/3'-5' exonuclease PolX
MRLHHPIRFKREDVEPILQKFMTLNAEVWPCGSWRRNSPDVGDLDLVIVGPVDGSALFHQTEARELFERKRTHLMYKVGKHRFEVEITSTDEDHLGGALLHCTGDAKWNQYLRIKALLRGWRLSERGLYEGDHCIAAKTEKEILEALDEPWREPEHRCNID